MNANSLHQAQTINNWLVEAIPKLQKVGISSARLDAELILANSINKSRTYLHAHNNLLLNVDQTKTANSQLQRRTQHEPIAYIVGYKDFYGRKFIVTPNTLIPRPESEDFIEVLKKILPLNSIFYSSDDEPTPNPQLIDVGTGCGCLGITAKLEFSSLDVLLIDISKEALLVAQQNANIHSVTVNCLNNDMLKNLTYKPNIIIANLPYVDETWEKSPDTGYEPHLALFADKNGLSSNELLIAQASEILKINCYLLIEADPSQQLILCKYAKKYNFKLISITGYVISFQKL